MLALIPLLLFGCASDPCAEATGAIDVTLLSPTEHWAGLISATLPDELERGAITVSLAGDEVTGTVEKEGRELHFRPDSPLRDDTTYLVDVTGQCQGGPVGVSTEVRTEPFVQPLDDPAAVVGATFAGPGDSFYILRPAGATGGGLVPYLHMVWLPMMRLTDPEAGTAELIWTTQDDPEVVGQKPCSLPVEVDLDWRDPVAHLSSPAVEVVTGMGSVRLYDFEMRATVSQDGQQLGRSTATAHFDLRDLYEELGYTSASDLCSDLASLDAPCRRCPDQAMACLSITLEGFVGERVDDTPVQDEDVCGLEDARAVWGEDAVFRAPMDGSIVEKVDFGGQVLWTTELDRPVEILAIADEDELVAYTRLSNGTFGLWSIDRETGEALYRGGQRFGGTALFWGLVSFFAGVGFFFGCSTAGGPTGASAVLLALAALFLRRRNR